jgi:hypothetical protein
MQNIIETFPNMILNKVDVSINCPKYWKLSDYHKDDIKKIVNDYYSPLKEFYDDKVIKNILNIFTQKCKNLLKLAKETPSFTEITYKGNSVYNIFDKRTSILIYENYFLQTLMEYIHLANDKNMILLEFEEQEENTLDELNTVESLEEKSQFYDVRSKNDDIIQGDIKNQKSNICSLLIAYLKIVDEHKSIVDMSYEKIMDLVFKIKEKEKDTFTDRLKGLTDEERNVDNILKMNKLGAWGKGLEKGLINYDAQDYDDDREQMEKLAQIEKNVRKNRNVNDENLEQYIDDYIEDYEIGEMIDNEEYDLSKLNEDFMDGDYDGYEEENWNDYN